MFLSKLVYSPGVKGKAIGKFEFQNEYNHHQWLWKCFDENENGQLSRADFIFRHDVLSNIPVIYLLSERKPAESVKDWKISVNEFTGSANEGDLVQFSLRANPTVAITVDGKQTRHDVLMHAKFQCRGADNTDVLAAVDDAAKGWLVNREEMLGVQFISESVEFSNYKQHKISKERNISISSLDYSGLLRVKDADVFNKKLCKGIGRAKAFGCGLMLVRHL